jgi:hypothetical protein
MRGGFIFDPIPVPEDTEDYAAILIELSCAGLEFVRQVTPGIYCCRLLSSRAIPKQEVHLIHASLAHAESSDEIVQLVGKAEAEWTIRPSEEDSNSPSGKRWALDGASLRLVKFRFPYFERTLENAAAGFKCGEHGKPLQVGFVECKGLSCEVGAADACNTADPS